MFDYLAVLISVILGLALTHLLLGYGRLIHHRQLIRIDWVQLLWAANIILFVLAIWWGMFWWKHLTVWTIQLYFFLTLYSIELFVLASVLFPGEFSHVRDYRAMFAENRHWFFGLLLGAHLLDIPETVAKQLVSIRPVPREYWVAEPLFLAIAIGGLLSGRRIVQATLAPAWTATMLSYVIFSSLDQISAG